MVFTPEQQAAFLQANPGTNYDPYTGSFTVYPVGQERINYNQTLLAQNHASQPNVLFQSGAPRDTEAYTNAILGAYSPSGSPTSGLPSGNYKVANPATADARSAANSSAVGALQNLGYVGGSYNPATGEVTGGHPSEAAMATDRLLSGSSGANAEQFRVLNEQYVNPSSNFIQSSNPVQSSKSALQNYVELSPGVYGNLNTLQPSNQTLGNPSVITPSYQNPLSSVSSYVSGLLGGSRVSAAEQVSPSSQIQFVPESKGGADYTPLYATVDSKGKSTYSPALFSSNLPAVTTEETGYTTVYPSFGNYLPTEIQKAKVGVSPVEYSIYQKLPVDINTGKQRSLPSLYDTTYTDELGNTQVIKSGTFQSNILIGGGGRNAPQSGTVAFTSMSPVAVEQATGKYIFPQFLSPGVKESGVTPSEVIAAHESNVPYYDIPLSRLGAEAYGGVVSHIDNRTLGNITYENYKYPAGQGNLSDLTYREAVNLPKSVYPGANIPWSVGDNIPSVFSMSPILGTREVEYKPIVGVDKSTGENIYGASYNRTMPIIGSQIDASPGMGFNIPSRVVNPTVYVPELSNINAYTGKVVEETPSTGTQYFNTSRKNLNNILGLDIYPEVSTTKVTPVIVPASQTVSLGGLGIAPAGSLAGPTGFVSGQKYIMPTQLLASDVNVIPSNQLIPGVYTTGEIGKVTQTTALPNYISPSINTTNLALGDVGDNINLYGLNINPLKISNAVAGFGQNVGDISNSFVNIQPSINTGISITEKSNNPIRNVTSSESFSGGNQTISNLGNYLETNRSSIDVTNPSAVAQYNDLVKTYNEMSAQNPIVKTTTTTQVGTPDTVYQYGEFDKWVADTGKLVSNLTGITSEKTAAYQETIKSQPGIMGDINRIGAGVTKFAVTEPGRILPYATVGAALALGGEAVGGALGLASEGTGILGTAAKTLTTPGTGGIVGSAVRGITTYAPLAYFAGLGAYQVSEGFTASKEKIEQNVGESFVPTLAMIGGGLGVASRSAISNKIQNAYEKLPTVGENIRSGIFSVQQRIGGIENIGPRSGLDYYRESQINRPTVNVASLGEGSQILSSGVDNVPRVGGSLEPQMITTRGTGEIRTMGQHPTLNEIIPVGTRLIMEPIGKDVFNLGSPHPASIRSYAPGTKPTAYELEQFKNYYGTEPQVIRTSKAVKRAGPSELTTIFGEGYKPTLEEAKGILKLRKEPATSTSLLGRETMKLSPLEGKNKFLLTTDSALPAGTKLIKVPLGFNKPFSRVSMEGEEPVLTKGTGKAVSFNSLYYESIIKPQSVGIAERTYGIPLKEQAAYKEVSPSEQRLMRERERASITAAEKAYRGKGGSGGGGGLTGTVLSPKTGKPISGNEGYSFGSGSNIFGEAGGGARQSMAPVTLLEQIGLGSSRARKLQALQEEDTYLNSAYSQKIPPGMKSPAEGKVGTVSTDQSNNILGVSTSDISSLLHKQTQDIKLSLFTEAAKDISSKSVSETKASQEEKQGSKEDVMSLTFLGSDVSSISESATESSTEQTTLVAPIVTSIVGLAPPEEIKKITESKIPALPLLNFPSLGGGGSGGPVKKRRKIHEQKFEYPFDVAGATRAVQGLLRTGSNTKRSNGSSLMNTGTLFNPVQVTKKQVPAKPGATKSSMFGKLPTMGSFGSLGKVKLTNVKMPKSSSLPSSMPKKKSGSKKK